MNYRRIRHYLSARPLVSYGLVYVGLIVGFATIDWCMPGQFFHPTAMYEPTLLAEMEKVEREIEKAFREQCRRNAGSDVILLGGPGESYEFDYFEIDTWEYKDRRFKVTAT